MAKKKGIRRIITLECTEARAEGNTPSRYTTQKNTKNTPERYVYEHDHDDDDDDDDDDVLSLSRERNAAHM